MKKRKTADGLPARLETGRKRFDRWRRNRSRGTRIPEPLWTIAVELAADYGLHRTAKTLALDYYSLRDRLEQSGAGNGSDEPAAAAAFVELAMPSAPRGGECLVEFEDPSGAKMRVHLKGSELPDLDGLSRAFWSRQP